MKPLAIILIILVLAALVGVGYLYFTSNLTVTFSSVVATDPVDQAEAFDQVRTSVENETFIGTKYSAEQLAGPENYLFYTWTVQLENRSFLPQCRKGLLICWQFLTQQPLSSCPLLCQPPGQS